MDIFSPTILDNALITGSNNANLLQVSSPSAPSALFVSGSGNVGIGTTTPSTTLQVAGTSSLQHIIFDTNNIYDIGTSAVRARNIWSNGNVVGTTGFFSSAVMYNSARIGGEHTATALLHISGSDSAQMMRINSPTNANILFVSGSGNIGVGTTTPGVTLDVVGQIRASNTMFNSVTQTQQIVINSATNLRFLSASVETARYDNNGWGFFNNAPAAKVHISGANADNLFRVSSPSAPSTLFISGSGNVGIGTTTPVHNLVVDGNTGISINAGGATFPNIHRDSADGGMLLRSWNGSTFTNNVKITPTSAVGIGTTNPIVRLHLSQSSGVFQRVDINNANADGVNATTQYYTNTGAAPDFFGATSFRLQGGTTDAFKQFQVYIANLTSPRFIINGSGNVGINTTSPNARLHISGANNEALLIASSSTAPSALFVSGSGNVGIGTGTPTRTLYVSSSAWDNTSGAGVVIENSNTVGSGLTLKPSNSVVTNGSNGWAIYAGGPGAVISDGNLGFWAHGTNEARLVIQRAGNVGIGETSPSAKLEIRGSGATSATTALRVENSNASASLVVRDDGNVGIGITSPTDLLDVFSSSDNQRLIRISHPTAPTQAAGFFGFNSDGVTNNVVVTLGVQYSSVYYNVINIKRDTQNVGIGTTSPTSRLQVRGSGATSATTALRVENSNATASLVVRDDGNVGIGTTSPITKLHVSGNIYTEDNLIIPSGKDILIRDVVDDTTGTIIRGTYDRSGIDPNFDYVSTSSIFLAGLTNTRIDLFGTNTTYIGGLPNFGRILFTIPNSGNALFSSPSNANILFVSGSGRVGVGTTTPQRLFDVYNSSTSGIAASFGAQISINNFSGISFGYVEQTNASYRKSALVFERTDGHGGGSNASGKIHFLLNNNSSTSATALTDSVLTIDSVGTTVGSSRVGIGTRFPTASLHISGTVATDNLMRVQSTTGAEYFFISASGNVGVGLLTPSARLHVSGANNQSLLQVSSPSASSALFISGSGNVGVGTATPAGLIDIFQGGNSRILVTTDNGFVGLQQSSPAERIHITSDPVNGKYLQIDAGQTSNAPRQVVDSPATAIIGYAAGDSTVYLSEPRWWMEIKLDGNIVLIPCYQPDV